MITIIVTKATALKLLLQGYKQVGERHPTNFVAVNTARGWITDCYPENHMDCRLVVDIELLPEIGLLASLGNEEALSHLLDEYRF